ncbi:hypothetical protein POHY109586_06070 [Polaromonas hydrogenivorans]
MLGAPSLSPAAHARATGHGVQLLPRGCGLLA